MPQGHYCRTIDQWTSYFPEEQLLIGFFDEIESDPRGLMGKIFLHIGVDTDIDWSRMPLKDVVNSNPTYPLLERFRVFLEDLYADELRRLRQRLGGAPVDWLRQR